MAELIESDARALGWILHCCRNAAKRIRWRDAYARDAQAAIHALIWHADPPDRAVVHLRLAADLLRPGALQVHRQDAFFEVITARRIWSDALGTE